jgi:hypothetical protein
VTEVLLPAVAPRRSWAHVGSAVAAGALRTAWLPGTSRRQQRVLVRSAADLLSAAGVRVVVRAPATAWPRTGVGRLVVADDAGWLGALALLTAVPGVRVLDDGAPAAAGPLLRCGAVVVETARPRSLPATVAAVAERLRAGATVVCQPGRAAARGTGPAPFRSALLQAAVDTGAPVCPVALAVCGPDGAPLPVRARPGVRDLAAAAGAVVEVVLLPALGTAGAHRRSLAARAAERIATGTAAPARG